MSWQESLDRLFPDGASVTQVEDVPEGTDDSVQFLTPKLLVLAEFQDPVGTVVTCQIYGIDKDVTFEFVELKEFADQVWLAKCKGPHDFLLSNLFDGEPREVLRAARKEWYG